MSIDAQAASKVEHPPIHTIYLALGSNLGNRQAHLSSAIQRLQQVVSLQRTSSLYETEPVGYLDQPLFLNLVCQGTTTLTPQELLLFVKAIERELGRQLSIRNGPRIVDIDILLYDALILNEEQLVIPHPRMNERAFVLVPLAEIAPDAIEPAQHKSVRTLLASISQQGVKKVGPLA